MSFRPQPHYGLPINRPETYREDESGWCRYGEVRRKGTTEVVGPFGMKFEDDYLITLRNAGSVKWKRDCEEGSVVLRNVSCYLQQEVKTGLPL